jgi:ferric-dicitrate binding protein FerR (iron transport regulator)
MNQERFKYLLQRYKADQLTDPEKLEWLEMVEDGACRSVIESDMEAFMANPLPDARWTDSLESDTWQRILHTRADAPPLVQEPAALQPSRLPVMQSRFRWIFLPAAAAACLLAAVSIWWLRRPSSALVASMPDKVIVAPRGAQYRVVLPDSTRVWLNAGSSLRYPSTFGSRDREVSLQGEAYFEVGAGSSMPFKVKAGSVVTEGSNTRFDVKAYEGDTEYRTALLEGAIRVTNGAEKIVLQPGQAAVERTGAGKNGLRLATFDLQSVIAWKDRIFAFHRTPLLEVMRELGRWYDVQVQGGPGSDTLTINGFISRRETLENVLKMLRYTGHLRYSIKGKKVTLSLLRHIIHHHRSRKK